MVARRPESVVSRWRRKEGSEVLGDFGMDWDGMPALQDVGVSFLIGRHTIPLSSSSLTAPNLPSTPSSSVSTPSTFHLHRCPRHRSHRSHQHNSHQISENHPSPDIDSIALHVEISGPTFPNVQCKPPHAYGFPLHAKSRSTDLGERLARTSLLRSLKSIPTHTGN